ncbi:MAG: BamA/TamA family outer membrane protein, partial [Pseudomonadota bacterium]
LSQLSQTLFYDRRNSTIDPTDGYFISGTTDFAGLGGNTKLIRLNLRGAYYRELFEDINLILGGDAGRVFEWGGRDVRYNERFFLGGNNLRGFREAGAGPRDTATSDALGGQTIVTFSAETRFPIGLPEELGIKGAFFIDTGLLTDSVDRGGGGIRTGGGVRASVGVGANWRTPIGPVRFDFAQAVLEQSFDRTQFFRFSFATRF